MRKKFVLAVLIVFGFAAICVAETGNNVNGDMCKNINLISLRAHVPIPPAQIVSKRSVNGLCELILNIRGELVPVYATKNYVIAGEMFQDRTQITQTQINRLKAKRFLSLKSDVEKCVAFTLKPKGEVKHTVYMITDPVCPFCHRAETQLEKFAQEHQVEFKFIFYSVHPPVGRQKAIEAVCRKLSADDYLKGDWKNSNKTQEYQCQEGKELITQSEQLARKLGVRGVPMFYLEDGTLIPGANMPALAQALSKKVRKRPQRVSYAR